MPARPNRAFLPVAQTGLLPVEGLLHDLGVIAMLSSDSQGMGEQNAAWAILTAGELKKLVARSPELARINRSLERSAQGAVESRECRSAWILIHGDSQERRRE